MRREKRTALRHAAQTILIAVTFGPLFAGVAAFVFFVLVASYREYSSFSFVAVPQMLMLAVFVSYRFGISIAFIASSLVAVWLLWRPANLMIVLAASFVATVIWFVVIDPRALFGGESIVPRGNFFEMISVLFIAATSCWYLMRFLRGEL